MASVAKLGGVPMAVARWIVSDALRERIEPRAEIHEAFLALGCCFFCFRRLQRSS